MNESQENYTTTKKELLVIIFAFDKFHQYLVLSKNIVFTYHFALRYLFTKQDAKPQLIRWILLLQEFDIEIRDKKGAKNLSIDHLSRLENPDFGKLTKAKIRDLFPEERLMVISDKNNEPWHADYVNYLASRVLPLRSTRQEKQKFFSDLRHYFWDEPFLFKYCADRIIRRCVAEDEATQILRQCHSGPSGGHHGITTTARKVFKAGFYLPHIFRDAHFMGPFPSSNGNKYILVAIDYVSKWVEAWAFPTNDAWNVVNFLKRLFARFGIPKALISDRGTYFYNYQMEKAMKRLFPGKLNSRWYGPFSVCKDMKNGAIELYDEDGNEFIINKQRVKPYQESVLDTNRDVNITLDDEGEVTSYAVLSSYLTNKIACRKFLIKNGEGIFTDAREDVMIYPDGVASPAMLYLTRRSFKILRKFHWTILGGRFNQLSHVSSPSLSQPGEY
ncbi:putative nucleotidyltransferase, ribonuclease H [Tanacetum coccineum]